MIDCISFRISLENIPFSWWRHHWRQKTAILIGFCSTLKVFVRLGSISCHIFIVPHLYRATPLYILPHLYRATSSSCHTFIVPHLYISCHTFIVPHLYISCHTFIVPHPLWLAVSFEGPIFLDKQGVLGHDLIQIQAARNT